MTPAEFAYLRDLLKERSGLVVTEEKHYLLNSRLTPLARKASMRSLSELVAAMKAPDGEKLRASVVEAMTINESFFFRDKTPFDHFRDLMIPALMKARAVSRRLRIWCTAASTGQEPYSLAILIKELEDELAGWKVELFATDLSGEVLEKARAGLYSQFEVQRGLPIQKLVKHFNQSGSMWQINASLRSMVRFEQFNLLDGYGRFGNFDVIFCRNVLIYFDADTKRDILARIADQLAPDGYLVLGAAETVLGVTDRFHAVPDARGLYRTNPSTGAPAADASTVTPLPSKGPQSAAASPLAAAARLGTGSATTA